MPIVKIDEKYCKGCDLCVTVCPEGIIAIDESRLTAKGNNPAVVRSQELCTACTNCALICPDVAISIYREQRSREHRKT